MPDLTEIIDFVKTQYATFGYLIVFLSAYIENTIFLGIVLPGASLLILGAIFASQGALSLPLVILLGWMGMFLGCCTDYWIGRAGLWKIIEKTRLRRWLDPGLKRAEVFMHTRGRRALFISHAMGQVRTFISLTAGIVKMPFSRFVPAQLLITLIWCSLYCGAGFFVGGSLDSIQHFFQVMGMIMVVTLVTGYLIWKKRQAKAIQADPVASGSDCSGEPCKDSVEEAA